jgi:hypothetical protein
MTWLVMCAPLLVAAGAAGTVELLTGTHKAVSAGDWALIAAGVLYFLWWLRARRFPCPKCGHDLTRDGVRHACPRCGLSLDEYYP